MGIFDLFKQIEKQSAAAGPVTHIIAGLGNPGQKYEKTRHNIGFLALDYIAEKYGIRVDRVKFRALVGEGNIAGARVLLMKPETFMNNSGEAIGAAADFYKIPPERVIVLHDEISFSPSVIRIRRKGSAGGHNGLKSIISHLSSEEFPRIKIGVGEKPRPDFDLADWVLGVMPEADAAAVRERFSDIAAAAELLVLGKTDEAMNKYSK